MYSCMCVPYATYSSTHTQQVKKRTRICYSMFNTTHSQACERSIAPPSSLPSARVPFSVVCLCGLTHRLTTTAYYNNRVLRQPRMPFRLFRSFLHHAILHRPFLPLLLPYDASSEHLSHHLHALGRSRGGPPRTHSPRAIPDQTAELTEERRLEARPVEAEDADLPEVGDVVVAEEHAVLACLLPHAATDDGAAVGERLVDSKTLCG